MQNIGPIGVFDSGYGGLTVLREIVKALPQYDYVYLGDNARSPYGTRSFEVVHTFTLQCVTRLFDLGCPLVILACNTASAKALRTIQQVDLPAMCTDKNVLGVIRPTTEIVGQLTKTRHVGVLGTTGTIKSDSYPTEIRKFFPDITVHGEACPMWVPLVENDECHSAGAEYFVRKHVDKLLAVDSRIDTIILGCTHYPLLESTIRKFLPNEISLVSQGPIVAERLGDYLQRHRELEKRCSKKGSRLFYTTDDAETFDAKGSIFMGTPVRSSYLTL